MSSMAPLLLCKQCHPIAYAGPELKLILSQLLELCHPTSLLARSSVVNGELHCGLIFPTSSLVGMPEGEAWLFPAVPLALL